MTEAERYSQLMDHTLALINALAPVLSWHEGRPMWSMQPSESEVHAITGAISAAALFIDRNPRKRVCGICGGDHGGLCQSPGRPREPKPETLLVPREPTYDMLRAVSESPFTLVDCDRGQCTGTKAPDHDEARAIYKAMIAAAPK